MRFGVREICDVAFRAKSKMTLGGRTFYKNEPVIYFDSLKTSSLEGASTRVFHSCLFNRRHLTLKPSIIHK